MPGLRLRLLAIVFLALPLSTSAQTLTELNGSWALDRPASTFGPGDWGAAIIDIRVTATQVSISRTFDEAPGPAVWELPLDGSTLSPPRDKGTAQVVGGRLQITFQRVSEVVTYRYAVEEDTLRIERTIVTRSGVAPDFTHTMVYKRVKA
jgi:hypothetical protein